jgi:N-acetylglutamate synthase-like GNAT family acetyltransferase
MINVRPFAPQDADRVAALIIPIQQQEFGLPIGIGDQPDLQDIVGFYQHGCGNFWVAEDDGAVVGSIALLDIGNRQAALRKMFVASSYRGGTNGVAKHLLGTLTLWARRKHLSHVYLGTTSRFLAAHRFYEKHGFIDVAKSALPSSFPVMQVDSKFYVLEVGTEGN